MGMKRTGLMILLVIVCIALMISGCPKKTVVKVEPSVKKAEEPRAVPGPVKEEPAPEPVKKEVVEAPKIKEEEIKQQPIKEEPPKKEPEKIVAPPKKPEVDEALESKMLKDVHFDYDKYAIRHGDEQTLKENAALLMKHKTAKVQVEGHCDERGTNEYNLALGERRANSIKNYLVSVGIDANRIATISYGEEKPLDRGHNEEAWSKNRRGHFVISK